MTTQVKLHSGLGWGRLLSAGSSAGALTLALNALVYVLATQALGVDLLVAQPGAAALAPVPLIAVLLASFLPGLAAAVAVGVLARWRAQFWRLFFRLAGGFFVLSLVPLLTMDVASSVKLVLGAMHAIAALTITLVLYRRLAAH